MCVCVCCTTVLLCERCFVRTQILSHGVSSVTQNKFDTILRFIAINMLSQCTEPKNLLVNRRIFLGKPPGVMLIGASNQCAPVI